MPRLDNYEDLTNRVFGRWTVLEFAGRKGKKKCIYWLCRCLCGTIKEVRADHLTSGASTSCSCFNREILKARVGENNPMYGRKGKSGKDNYGWKGGRVITESGYVLIKKPDHPYVRNNGYVFEHRLVMEKKLGRYLKPEEVVHHVDGDISNNDPDNLELFENNRVHLSERNHNSERAAL